MAPLRTGTAAALGTGALAGAVGTLAMDRLWYARYRKGGGGDRFADWELSTGTTGFVGTTTAAAMRLLAGRSGWGRSGRHGT